MKIKAWLKYLCYIAIIFGAAYLKGLQEHKYIMDIIKRNRVNKVAFITSMLIMVVIGAILGLEHLLGEIKKEGKWKINVPKLVLLVIPSLYLTSLFIAYTLDQMAYEKFIEPIISFFKGSTSFILVFELALGYFLITSFYKGTAKEKEAITEEIDAADMENAEDSESLVDAEEESPEE